MIDQNELTGSIPTEIFLLTKLTGLNFCKRLAIFLFCCYAFKKKLIRSMHLTFFSPLIPTDKNNMTNSIPTEIGILTNLKALYLCKRLFTV